MADDLRGVTAISSDMTTMEEVRDCSRVRSLRDPAFISTSWKRRHHAANSKRLTDLVINSDPLVSKMELLVAEETIVSV